jgi:hypothetical protein
MSLVLQWYEPAKYSRRDAFGIMPTAGPAPQITPLRRAYTSVIEQQQQQQQQEQAAIPLPTPSPQLQLPSNNPAMTRQAQLLQYVRRSQSNPELEDSQGRNGLQCLAAAILSPDTLIQKFGGPGANLDAQPNRKRKRNEAGAGTGTTGSKKEMLDSSRDRLMLRENLVRSMIADGVQVNHYDHDGNTVLMSFVAQLPEDDDYKVPVSILQLLIDSGADIHARTRLGETALHVAVRRGRKLAMRTLVQAGANVHARDGEGRSVLDVADLKLPRARDGKTYAHYEACRAWLSGQGRAVQNPTIKQEWGQGPAGHTSC